MMRAIKCLKPGGLDALNFVSVPIPSLGPSEVLIKVHSTALNRADVLQRRGLYNPPPGTTDILGLECSGEIFEPNGSQWAKGDKVMGFLRGGGYAEYVKLHKDHAIKVPDNVSMTQAAAIAEAWLTAYKCLVYIGKASKGQSVLIHAGASGIGTALIPLAKHKGLKVFTTCGSEEKTKICKELGADIVVNYKNNNFSEVVRQNGGTDLIMDSVGSNYFSDNIQCINKEGKWVVYGFLSGSKVKEWDMSLIFSKLVSLHFTSFRARSDEFRTDVIQKFVADGILDEFAKGNFKPLIYKEITWDEVKSGHEIMEKNENFGKIVMKIV